VWWSQVDELSSSGVLKTSAFDENGDLVEPEADLFPAVDDVLAYFAHAAVTPDGDVMLVWTLVDSLEVVPVQIQGIIYPKMFPQP